jgi:hypothetical protein
MLATDNANALLMRLHNFLSLRWGHFLSQDAIGERLQKSGVSGKITSLKKGFPRVSFPVEPEEEVKS